MPKIKIDEDDEIVSFSIEETDALDKYFKGTNAETAYMLGRYCGLRINECYGLLWSNVLNLKSLYKYLSASLSQIRVTSALYTTSIHS